MTKRISDSNIVSRMLSLALVAVLTTAAWGQSPSGEQVISGSASVTRDGNSTVIQAANNTIIDWQSFSIGAGKAVQFIQPGARSRVLNRDLSGSITHINGSLTSNGLVYIANPAGIFIGGQATISVGGLYAAAGSITNQDFLSNIDVFSDLNGSVINEGHIQGHIVHLIGRQVINRGTIFSDDGIVTMLAGDEVYIGERGEHIMVKVQADASVDPATTGVENSGTIDAGPGGRVVMSAGDMYSLAVTDSSVIRGGDVTIEGQADSTVDAAGKIDASNADGVGGTVRLLGDEVALYTVDIDVTGSLGAGNIYVGGSFQGKGSLRNSTITYVSPDAVLRGGTGGEIIVWSDVATAFYGTLDAPGGFAEVSGKQYLSFAPAAINMSGGSLLLDPQDLFIAAAGTNDAAYGALGGYPDLAFNEPDIATDWTISFAAIDAAGDVSVTLQAHRDLTVNEDMSLQQTAGQTVTFEAGRSLTLNNIVETDGGALVFNADNAGGLNDGTGSITVNAQVGDADTGDISFTVDGLGNVLLNDNVVSAGNVVATTSGEVRLAAAVSVDTSGAGTNQTYTAQDLVFGAASAMDAGAGNLTFIGTSTIGVGSGAGTMRVTDANLALLTAADVTFRATGANALDVAGTTAANTANISGTTTFENTGTGTVSVTADTELTNDVTVSAAGAAAAIDGVLKSAAGDVSVTGTSVALGAAGGIDADDGAGQAVTLNATVGGITQNTGGAGIQTDTLNLQGTGNASLADADNNVGVINSSHTGNVTYVDADGFAVGDGGGAGAGITTTGNAVDLTATTGTLTVDDDIDAGASTVALTGDSVTFTTGAITGNGGVTVTTDGLTYTAGSITSTGSVAINTRTGTTTVGLNNGASNLNATTAFIEAINADTGLTIGDATSGALTIAATDLKTGASFDDSLTLATGGTATFTGSLVLADNSTLTLQTGAVTTSGGNDVTIDGGTGTLVFDTSGAVGATGTPIQTQVSRLSGQTSAGGFFVENTGDLTVGNYGGISGVQVAQTGATEDIEIVALSAVTVSTDVIGDNVTITATDSAGAGDDLTIDSGATVQSTVGTITLNVGDNLDQQAGTTLNAATTIGINADQGALDAGNGSTVDIAGTVTATGAVTITGGSEDDTFDLDVAVGGGGAYAVVGGTGTDTLDLSTLAVATPVVLSAAAADGFDGAVTGIVTSFTDIDTLTGGSGGTDQLTGYDQAAGNAVWGLDGTPTLTEDTFVLNFTGFETLTGAGDVDVFNLSANTAATLQGGAGADQFVFSDGVQLTGSIDGGADGDTLTFAAYTSAVNVTLTGSAADGFAGTAAGATDPLIGAGTFADIDTLTGSGLGTESLTGYASGGTSTWTLDGTPTLAEDGNTLNFSGFATLIGSTDVDAFTVSANSAANIQGGDAADTFGISAGVTLTGTITGDAGVDVLTLGDGAIVTGLVDGAADGLSIDLSAYTTAVNVALSAAGGTTGFDGTTAGATNPLTTGFDNTTDLVGTAASDSLTGINDAATWDVDDVGGSTYTSTNALTFDGFDTLIGNADVDAFTVSDDSAAALQGMANDDTFDIVAGKTLTGTIDGGANDDTITYGDDASVTGVVDGGTGSDTLDLSAYTTSLSLGSIAAGTGDGIQGVINNNVPAQIADFDNINSFTGSGADTLVGSAGADAFSITGADAVTYLTIPFTGITSLEGGAGADTFTFSDAATLSGTIDGGTGAGNDHIDLSAYTTAVAVALTGTGTDNGFAGTTNGGVNPTPIATSFDNINEITGTGTGAGDSLTGINADAAWLLALAGNTYTSTNVLTFAGFKELTGNGGDDTLTVDFTGGDPMSNDPTFNGAGQAASDSVVLQNGAGLTTITHTFTTANDGTVDVDGSTLTYTGLEPITDNLSAANRIFTFSNVVQTITVSDTGGAGDNVSRIDSTVGELVDFVGPTTALTINGGTNNDTINVQGLDTTSNPTVAINGNAGDDIIVLGETNGDLDLIGTSGAITIAGGANNDTLTINDSLDGTNRTWAISDTQITRSSAAAINYGTTETLNVTAGAGADTIGVTGIGATTAATINGGTGNDAYTVTLGGTYNVNPTLNDAGGATDTLTINGSGASETITVDGQTRTVTESIGATAVTYTANTIEQFTVNSQNGDTDVIQITDDLGVGDSFTSVTLTAVQGGVTDGNAAGIDITATSLTISAQDGIGAADALETAATNLSLTNSGDANVQVANTLNTDVTVSTATTAAGNIVLSQDGTGALGVTAASTTNGAINITSDDTNLTVGTVTAGGANDVTLTTTNAGNVLVDNVTAAGDQIQINSAGTILESGTDAGADLTASTLDLNADTGIGAAGTAIETAASTLTADNTTSGAIVLTNDVGGALALTSATTPDGNITIINNGDVSLGAVAANGAGNTVTLTATGGAVTDAEAGADTNADITAANASVVANSFGAAGNPIDTTVDSLTVNTSGNDGDILVDETNALTALSLNAGAGDVTLVLDEGGVADADGSTDITATDLVVTLTDTNDSGDSFGASGTPIATNVTTLSVDADAGAVAGGIFVTETSGLTNVNLLALAATPADIELAVGGNVAQTTGEVQGDTLTLTGTGDVNLGTNTNDVNTLEGNLTGSLTLDDADGVVIGAGNLQTSAALTVNSLGAGAITVTGNATAGTTLTLNNTSGVIDGAGLLTATTLNLDATTGISNGAAGLNTAATSIAADSSTSGDVLISNTTGTNATFTSVTTDAGGNIEITQAGAGDLITSGAVATDATGTIDITHTGTGDITLGAAVSTDADNGGGTDGGTITITGAANQAIDASGATFRTTGGAGGSVQVAGGSVSLPGGAAFTVGAGDVVFNGGGDTFTLSADLTNLAAPFTVAVDGDVLIDAALSTTAGNAISLTGDDNADGTGGVRITAGSGSVQSGDTLDLLGSDIIATAAITDDAVRVGGSIEAAGDLTLDGRLAGENVWLGSTIDTTAAGTVDVLNNALVFANTTITSDGDVTFEGTLDEGTGATGSQVVVDTANASTTWFKGSVGGTNPLQSITTNADGETQFGVIAGAAVGVSTDGATQTYNNAVVVNVDTTFTDAGSGVFFNNTLDSDAGNNRNVVVNTTGTTQFGDGTGDDNVGGNDPLGTLTTNAGGTTVIAATQVTTAGAINFNDNVRIDDNSVSADLTTITTTGAAATGADINFGGTINGTTAHQEDLTLDPGTTGSIGITGEVGGGVVMGDITIDRGVNVTADNDITANSLTQTTGTGNTQITGDVTTTGPSDTVGGAVAITTDGAIQITGTTTTLGGPAGAGNPGQQGGDVTLVSNTSNIQVGGVNANGSPNNGAGNGGDAGNIAMTANGGAGSITLGGNVTAVGGNGVVQGDGGQMDFNGNVVLGATILVDTGATANDTASPDIDISGTLTGPFGVTFNTGLGDLIFNDAVNITGDLVVSSVADWTNQDTITAASITQSAGTGLTTFNDDLATNSAGGIDLNGIDFTFTTAAVTTTGGGGLSISLGNNGDLIIDATSDFNLDGAFLQDGTGVANTVSTAGDIVTSDADIEFNAPVTLTGSVLFNTGSGIGDLTLASTLTGGGFDVVAATGGGDMTFTGAVAGVDNFTIDDDAATTFGARDVEFGSTVNVTTDFTIDDARDVNFANTLTVGGAFLQTTGTGTTTFTGDANITGTTNLTTDGVVVSAGFDGNGSDITFTVDTIALNGAVDTFTSAGATLTLQPRTVDRNVNIGGGTEFELTAAEINSLDDGFTLINLGRINGTGVMTFTAPVTFEDPTVFRMPVAGGEIVINENVLGIDDASFVFDTQATSIGDADILTDGNLIDFVSSVALNAVTLSNDVNIRTTENGNPAGANVRFEHTINGSTAGQEDLTIDAGTGGDITFGITPAGSGVIGAGVRLGQITITNANDVDFNGSVTAAGITQTAGQGTTTFNATINTDTLTGLDLNGTAFTFTTAQVTTTAGGTVTITNSGLLTVDAASDMNLDGAFLQDGAGAVQTAGDITTTNDTIGFTGTVALTGNVIHTGSTVTYLNTVDASGLGGQTLTVNGNAVFGDANTDRVGSGTALGNLLVTGNTTLRADAITASTANGATGDIQLGNSAASDAILLDNQDTGTITITANDVDFQATINESGPASADQNLVVNTSGGGNTYFRGVVGASNRVASVTTNADGITHIMANITTNGGTQVYNDPVLIYAAAVGGTITLSDFGDTGIAFNNILNQATTLDDLVTPVADGSFILALNVDADNNAAGTLTFDGIVGGNNALRNITVGANGTTDISTTAITTVEDQTFNNLVILTDDVILTGNDVFFGQTVNSSGGTARDLTVNTVNSTLAPGTAGITTFTGEVGTGVGGALDVLTTNANGTTRFIADVTAATVVTNDPVEIGADPGDDATVTMTANTINFASTVDSITGENNDLTVDVATSVTFGGQVGNTQRLSDLIVTDSNDVAVTNINGGLVQTVDNQTYNDDVVLGADTILDSTSGTITFGDDPANDSLNSSAGNNFDLAATAANITVNALIGNGEGGTAPLNDLSLSSAGVIQLNAATIQTDPGADAGDVLFTGGGNLELTTDVTIDTDVADDEAAGSVSTVGVTVSGDAAGHDLTLNTLGGATGGAVTLGLFNDAQGGFLNLLTIDTTAVAPGATTLQNNISLDDDGAGTPAAFTITGNGDVIITHTTPGTAVVVDTQQSGNDAGGAVNWNASNVYAGQTQQDLTLDTSTASAGDNGGAVTFGLVDNNAGGNNYLNDLAVTTTPGAGGTAGVTTLNGSVLLDDNGAGDLASFVVTGDGNVVVSHGTTVTPLTIDTQADAGGANDVGGGPVNLNASSVSGDQAGLDLTIDTTSVDGNGGDVAFGELNDDGGFYLNDVSVDTRSTNGTNGVLTLDNNISTDENGGDDGSVTLAGFVDLDTDVIIDTEDGDNGDAGAVTLTNAIVSGVSADRDLTINANSGGGNGGAVTLGLINNRAGEFLNDLGVNTNGTVDGAVTLTNDVSLDDGAGPDPGDFTVTGGGNVVIDPATGTLVTVDTENGDNADAGAVNWGASSVSAANAGDDLSINTSTTGAGNGGAVTFGEVNNDGGNYLNDLTVDTRSTGGGTDGIHTVGADIMTDSVVGDAGTVSLAGDVRLNVALVTIDTEQGNDGEGGSVDLINATVSSNAQGNSLAITTSTTNPASNGGNVDLGLFSNGGGQFVNDFDITTTGTAASGSTTLHQNISLDDGDDAGDGGDFTILGGGDVIVSATVTVDTQQAGAGAGGNVTWGDAVNGWSNIYADAANFDLTINTTASTSGPADGNINIGLVDDNAGGNFFISDLVLTNADAAQPPHDGITTLFAAAITVDDTLTVNGPFELTVDTTLTTNGTNVAGDVNFALNQSTINTSTLSAGGTRRSLTVNTGNTGTTTFGGEIGGIATRELSALTTNADGTTVILADVTTVGTGQTYNDPVLLDNLFAGTLNFTDTGATGISFMGTLNSQDPGDDVDANFVLTGGGDLLFTGIVGGTNRLGDVLVTSTDDLTANAAFTARSFTQEGAVINTTGGTGNTTFLGLITTSGVAGDVNGGNIRIFNDGDITLFGGANTSAFAASGGNAGHLVLNADLDQAVVPGTAGTQRLLINTGATGWQPENVIRLDGTFALEGDGAGAHGDFLLNVTTAGDPTTGGRRGAAAGDISAVATISGRQIEGSDVTITCADFTIGQFEKATFFGDLNVATTGGDIRVGDISTVGNIDFDVPGAQAIVIWLRPAAQVLDFNNVLSNDLGADITSGDVIDFSETPTTANAAGNPGLIFASPGGDHDPSGFGGILSSFINRDTGSLEAFQFVLGGVLPGSAAASQDFTTNQPLGARRATLDISSAGPSTANVSEAIAGAVPRPEQSGDVQQDTAPGQSQRDLLAQLGYDLASLPASQLIEFLSGRALYNDLGGGTGDRVIMVGGQRQITRDRLTWDPVTAVITKYTQMFLYEEIDPATGESMIKSRHVRLRRAIGEAHQAYLKQAGTFDGVGFRQFLASNEAYRQAADAVQGLGDLFRLIEVAGLTPSEVTAAKTTLLPQVTPEGMTPSQLIQAIEAGPANGGTVAAQ